MRPGAIVIDGTDLGACFQGVPGSTVELGAGIYRWQYECLLCGLRLWQSSRGAGSEALREHAEAHARAKRP